MLDDLTLTVPGTRRNISGWQSIRVTRGIERMPTDFTVTMTDRIRSRGAAVSLSPGDPVQVRLGDDLVMTGYVDAVQPTLSAGQHEVGVSGRGKCQDLVDCAAQWKGCQVVNCTVLDVAQKLAKPYSITVATDQGGFEIMPQDNLGYCNTAWSVIDKYCRYNALLAYERPDGSLFLTRTGSGHMASGLREGVNIETATLCRRADERYSEYWGYLVSMDLFEDAGESGMWHSTAVDPQVTRPRLKIIVVESGSGGLNMSQKRVDWEAARRIGRSAQLSVRVDSWRDFNEKLWEPNSLVSVDLPTFGLEPANWLISEVTYSRDESGTHADLVLMDPRAFLPQPFLLQPIYGDIG